MDRQRIVGSLTSGNEEVGGASSERVKGESMKEHRLLSYFTADRPKDRPA